MIRTSLTLLLLLLILGDGAIALVAAAQLFARWRKDKFFAFQGALFLCLFLHIGGLIVANSYLPRPIAFTIADMHKAGNPDAELQAKMDKAAQVDALWDKDGASFRLVFLADFIILGIGLWPAAVNWLVVFRQKKGASENLPKET
jgi:hypothetical protein